VELFTAEEFEFETVAPLAKLNPAPRLSTLKNWHLFRDIPQPQNDTDIDRNILPLILKIKSAQR